MDVSDGLTIQVYARVNGWLLVQPESAGGTVRAGRAGGPPVAPAGGGGAVRAGAATIPARGSEAGGARREEGGSPPARLLRSLLLQPLHFRPAALRRHFLQLGDAVATGE